MELSFDEKELEAQSLAKKRPIFATLEDIVANQGRNILLLIYIIANVGLTLCTKGILGVFKYPILLAAVQTGFTSLGCFALYANGRFELSKLACRENHVLLAFSVLFTISIALTNISLGMTSIVVHQIVCSAGPVFTVLVYRLGCNKTHQAATHTAVGVFIVCVALMAVGDFYFTNWSILITLLCVLVVSIKIIAANCVMIGSLKLHPLELLHRISLLSFLQALALSVLTGELQRCHAEYFSAASIDHYHKLKPRTILLAVLGNGLLALALHVSSFATNKNMGALTMTICANFKQLVVIIIGLWLWEGLLTMINATGFILSIAGAAVYCREDLLNERLGVDPDRDDRDSERLV